MKKVALSLAGVLAAAAFAPEASALPAFARQTGMACTACHFQHFPVLNGFGQAFRASGYTLMGAQGKVEGDHLSIPDTMNAAFLLKVRYQTSNGPKTAGEVSGDTTRTGQLQFPDEYSLFFGGRIADSEMIKMGFMTENAPAGGASGIFNGIKTPIVVSLGVADVLVVPFMTDALGVAYGFEQSSTGATRGIRWAEHRRETSAAQYTGIGASGQAGTNGTTGVAFVAKTDMGYVNFTQFAPGVLTNARLSSKYIRVAATPTVADWNLHIAAGFVSGHSATDTASISFETKGNMIDVQAQGELAGMETSFYLQNSTANKSSGDYVNLYNTAGTEDVKATTIGADFTVIPHTLTVGVALRKAKNGGGFNDDATTLTAVYDLFQNVALVANYSTYSGNAKDNGGYLSSVSGLSTGTAASTLMLEASY